MKKIILSAIGIISINYSSAYASTQSKQAKTVASIAPSPGSQAKSSGLTKKCCMTLLNNTFQQAQRYNIKLQKIIFDIEFLSEIIKKYPGLQKTLTTAWASDFFDFYAETHGIHKELEALGWKRPKR